MNDETTTMSMRDYSRLHHVSYESIRAQVKRYQAELEGHTYKEEGSKKIILDEFAVKFLDKHRRSRVVVVKASEDETQKELDRLKQQVELLQAELVKTNKELAELHKSREKLIEDNARNAALLLIADKEHDELQETKQVLSDTKLNLELSRTTCNTMQQELAESKQALNNINIDLQKTTAELGKYHKSLFGFYRKDS